MPTNPEIPLDDRGCNNCYWYQNLELSGCWGCANPDFMPDCLAGCVSCDNKLWEQGDVIYDDDDP